MNNTILEFLYEFYITRDYFECHEILEEAWIEESKNLDKIHPYVALLQVSVSFYHWRRDNFSGALSLMKGALTKSLPLKKEIENLGFQFEELIEFEKEIIRKIERYEKYFDPILPTTAFLFDVFCKKYNLETENPFNKSNMNDIKLIHHHRHQDKKK